MSVVKPRAGFAFVANVRAIIGPARVQLAKGHQLRRATTKEIEKIKVTLLEFAPHPKFLYSDLWERRLHQGDGPQDVLPESQWRYFVVAFRGPNVTVERIREASDIAPTELEILFTVVDRGLVWHQDHVFQVLQEIRQNEDLFVDITAADAAEIRKLRDRIERAQPLPLDLKPFLRQLAGLKALPYRSPLRFLGYFAMLEGLLAHKPNNTDPYDSITRQVKKKLTLLKVIIYFPDHEMLRSRKQKGGPKAAPECLCCEIGNPLQRARDTSILQGVL